MTGWLITLAQAAVDAEAPLPVPTEPTSTQNDIWPGMLMAAGGMILLFVIMANLRKKMTRQQANQVDPRVQVEETRQTNALRNDTRQMMVELEDLTRRFGAQLDAKSTKLERLLDEADAKIAELRALQAGGGNVMGGKASSSSSKPVVAPARAEPEEVDPLAKEIFKLADSGKSAVDIARQLGEHVGKVELILALRQQNV